MNLILFHRHEIASSTREMVDLDMVDLDPAVAAAGTAVTLMTTSNSEDSNKDDQKNDDGGKKKKKTSNNVDPASSTNRSKATVSSPSSPYSGRFRVHLCPDLVTSHDTRIVHLMQHLHKRPGDSFRIGILGGNKGKATIIMVQKTATTSTTTSNDNGDNDNQQHKKRSRKEMSSHPPLDFFLLFDFDPTLPVSSCAQQKITLLLSMPFPKRLKYLWSQISSFGSVSRICIVRGALSDTNFCQSSVLNPTIYQPLVEDGLCQGCHTRDIQVDICVDQVLSQSIMEQLGLASSSSSTSTAMMENDNNSIVEAAAAAPTVPTKLAKVVLDCGDEEGNNNNSQSTNRLSLPLRDAVLQELQEREIGGGDARSPHHCVIAVGSERGWTEDEAQMFSQ